MFEFGTESLLKFFPTMWKYRHKIFSFFEFYINLMCPTTSEIKHVIYIRMFQ